MLCRAAKHALHAIVGVFLVVVPTNAQHRSGTIVVLGLSTTRAVVAADSRLNFGKGKGFVDNYCKIVALGDRTIFTTVGRAGTDFPLLLLRWDAFDAARESRRLLPENSGIAEISRQWAQDAVAFWAKALQTNRQATTKGLKDNVILRGLFIGLGSQGNVQAVVTSISYDQAALASGEFKVDWRTVPLRVGDEKMLFYAFGKPQIVNELLHGDSAFARQERQNWEARPESKSPDADIYRAVRWVELTISLLPERDEVGGVIDVAELTDKGVRWIQRKRECSPQE